MPIENGSSSPSEPKSPNSLKQLGETVATGVQNFLQAPPDPGRRAAIGLGLLAPLATAFALHPEGRAISDNLGLLETYSMLGRLAIIPETLKFSQDQEDPGAIVLSGVTRNTGILPAKEQSARAARISITLHDRKAAKDLLALIHQAPGIIDTWNRVWQVGLVGATIAGSPSSGPNTVGSSSDGEFNPEDVKTYPPFKGPMGHLPKLAVLGAAGLFLAGCIAKGIKLITDATQTPEGKATATALAQLEATATSRLPTATPIVVQPTPGTDGTPSPAVEVIVMPFPETPKPFPPVAFTKQYLLDNGKILEDSILKNTPDTLPQPTPIPAPETGNGSPDIDPLTYTQDAFEIKETARYEFDFTDPVNILKYVVAQGARQGQSGGVTYFAPGIAGEIPAFSSLSIYREQLNIPQGEYTINKGYPKGLVLRNGAGLSVIGRDSHGDFVVAFEEYFSRGEANFTPPRMRIAVLTQNEFADISRDFLDNLKYFTNTTLERPNLPNEITYTDKSAGFDFIATLNTIDDDVMGLIRQGNIAEWQDTYTDPKSETGKSFFPEPGIPFPPDELIPQGLKYEDLIIEHWENPNFLGSPSAVRLYARDPGTNNVVSVANYDKGKHEWKWEKANFHEILDLKGKTFGVFIDPRYNTIDRNGKTMYENFNLLQPGTFSWDWIRRNGPNIYSIDFELPDQWVNFAVRNQMKVRNGNSLVSNGGLPDWLTTGKFTKEQLTSILREHISTVVGRYKGRVSEWLVANEVYIYYNGKSGIQDSIFYRVIGPEYVEMAFQAARQADPNATLIYNDFDIEVAGPKADYIFEQVKRLKEQGLIDAIGFQMHITRPPNLDAANPPTKEALMTQMRRYKDIGVEVVITELDVDASRLPGTAEQKLARQAEIYRMVVEACLEAGVNNISVWGLNDQESYLVLEKGYAQAAPLLFSNGQPKPAFEAVKDVIVNIK